MPAANAFAAASRAESDIAKLDVSAVTTRVLPGQPTDTDEPPEPLENGEPRRWAEFCMAATGVIFIGLAMLPKSLKKGQVWYTAAHSLNLATAIVLIVSLLWGNTHIKMLRFLSGKPIFAQVLILALVDWLRVMIVPDVGWEVTDRIGGTDGVQWFRRIRKVGLEDCHEVAEHEQEGIEQPKAPTQALQRVKADECEAGQSETCDEDSIRHLPAWRRHDNHLQPINQGQNHHLYEYHLSGKKPEHLDMGVAPKQGHDEHYCSGQI
jgi:hypothetical protein